MAIELQDLDLLRNMGHISILTTANSHDKSPKRHREALILDSKTTLCSEYKGFSR
jgi:hypothetical protein